MSRRVVRVELAKPAPRVHRCEDCAAVLAAEEIREYRAASNMGPRYRGVPRCCEACAFSGDHERAKAKLVSEVLGGEVAS